MPELPIETIATVREKRGTILYAVEAENGKIVLGHLSKAMTEDAVVLEPGERVLLQMTPYDFDTGRIAKRVD